MGQFWRILHEPQGETLHKWAEEVSHEGIIRYLDLFNTERIAVFSPKALAEILVTRSYEFTKPPQLIKGLGRILGVGLFLAEGYEHKVSSQRGYFPDGVVMIRWYGTETTQRSNASICVPTYKRPLVYPVFPANSRALAEAATTHTQWEGGDIATVDFGSWVSRAALDIIGVAGLGTDFQAIQDPYNELHQTYRKIFSPGRTGQLLGILSFLLPSWVIRALPLVTVVYFGRIAT